MKSQPKNEKYENCSVEVRVRLMVNGGCLPVRGFKGMEWMFMRMLVQLHIIGNQPSRGDRHLQSPLSRLLLNFGRQGSSSTLPKKISS